MNLPTAVRDWLSFNGYGDVKRVKGVAGGCISNGSRLEAESGNSFFLKWNPDAPGELFAREAHGLRIINVVGGPRVPEVMIWGPNFILLEDLNPARPGKHYWETFGRQLARLHLNETGYFGFDVDNYIGSTDQRNTPSSDGFEFFARQRLGYQVDLALSKSLLSPTDADRVMKLAGHLRDWVPVQPAAIVHGDLWAGNMISDEQGCPAMIDPAAHYGWPEADLAMTALFGRPPDSFYRAYSETRPLPPGFWSRSDIYNLYHLLNHLNIFGKRYYSQVAAILRRFE